MDQKINILKINSNQIKRKLIILNSKIENIRIIKGTNFDYFSEKEKKFSWKKNYTFQNCLTEWE